MLRYAFLLLLCASLSGCSYKVEGECSFIGVALGFCPKPPPAEKREPPPEEPSEPPPPRQPSELSVFSLEGQILSTSLTRLGVTALVTRRDGVGDIATRAPYRYYGSISAGGYLAEEPESADVITIGTDISAAFPNGRDFALNVTLADRIDEKGGAYDIFDGRLIFTYDDSAGQAQQAILPARLTLVNLDSPEGLGDRYSTVAFWEVTASDFLGNDAVSILGASSLGTTNGLYDPEYISQSGSVSYSGTMHGLYQSLSAAPEDVQGQASLTLDLYEQTIDGRVSDIQSSEGLLNDILLNPGYSLPHADPFWVLPHYGSAVSDVGSGDAGAPNMSGTYVATPYDYSATEVSGAVAVEGEGSRLVGGFVTERND